MRTRAMLWEKENADGIHCFLCAHHCRIKNGKSGVCGMRRNVNGELFTLAYGRLIANNIDPIEKKPLYHFLPGTSSYSIATIGCNFKCVFCQNWSISQLSERDTAIQGRNIAPEEIVEAALRENCRSISYTYTEPTIFFEYACDIAELAKEKGLFNAFVTNGYMTKETIDRITPFLDAANVDLKFFRDKAYKKICGGSLLPVLDSILNMKKSGVWVEVTTLIVPGQNDSDEELRCIAEFLADAGTEIPWHISRFHPDYKYLDSVPTPAETLERAMEIGRNAGLKYVYPGNILSSRETICSGCGCVLIDRTGFKTGMSEIFIENGKCRDCGRILEGVWE